MLRRLLPCLIFGCLFAAPVLAASINQLVAQAHLQQLARSPVWHALGHYRETLTGGLESQADDPDFFLSDDGKHNPRKELEATLRAVLAPGTGDNHAQCRFPARYHWLKQQLPLPESEVSCPAYESWLKQLNTETVTLVFAASYLNSPSSMFGHTFLRLDPPQAGEETDLLLASTISYAADAAAHENEIMFAYRGIFGGYPGVTAIQPYYELVKLYSDVENRDLWEYQLNLTPAETRQMLRHTWELRETRFDYYFLDENCAYRLLALIDVARPGTHLLDQVATHAIPSDTVRWIIDHELVAEVYYRPSSATVVEAQLGQLTEAQREQVLALAKGATTPADASTRSHNPAERARVLDAAYDYIRYQAREQEWPRERVAPLSYAILAERSRISQPSTLRGPGQPETRDDQGHRTFRLTVNAGRQRDRNYLELVLRPAYHGLLDPPAGYRDGAQLQFLRLDTRFYTDNEEWQIERLTAIEIRSLATIDRFFTPLSWQVGIGARRSLTYGERRVLAPYLEGGAGYLTRLGGWQVGLLGTADLELDDDLQKGWGLAPGGDLLALRQGERLSVMAGLKHKLWLQGENTAESQLYSEARLHFGKSHGVSFSAERSRLDGNYATEWALGWHSYF